MNKIKIIGLVLIIVGMVGFWYFRKNKDVDVISMVGKLMVLPNEVPTVATVTDKNKINGQSFFKSAENGDKVLIFSKASKAVLYRPSENKVIEVAVVNVGNNEPPTPISGDEVKKQLKVVIANGTQTIGLATKWEKNIKNLMSNIEVVDKISAKGNYQATVVIDLKGNLGNEAAELAGKIGAMTVALPTTENKPAADLLVIIGEDKR